MGHHAKWIDIYHLNSSEYLEIGIAWEIPLRAYEFIFKFNYYADP